MPPVYYALVPRAGSRSAAVLDACKEALAQIVGDRPKSGFLDFHLDTENTRNAANFNDEQHYGEKLARGVEDKIIALLRSGEAAPQANRQ
jgi:hypothetical protein